MRLAGRSAMGTIGALLALGACDAGPPEDQAQDAAATRAATGAASDGAGTAGPARPADETIPAALRGRWGLVPADCEPGRPDAKGLLVIGPTTLEFYESVGTLEDIEAATTDSLRADFAFTGEGMEWQRDLLLRVEDGGAALVRREYGPDAAPEPFRYARCRGEA